MKLNAKIKILLGVLMGFFISYLSLFAIISIFNISNGSSMLVKQIFLISFLIFTIFSIYSGVKAVRTKNIYYIVFKPNKYNILISLIISVIFILLIFYISHGEAFNAFNDYKQVNILSFSVVLGILYQAIILYPFSALVYYLYKNGIRRINIIIIIIFLLINPVSLFWSSVNQGYQQYHSKLIPCGLKITEIADGSPLKNVKISVNDVIVSVDDVKINTYDDLFNFLNNIKTPTEINIKTKTASFLVIPFFNNDTQKYQLGIMTEQEMCEGNK